MGGLEDMSRRSHRIAGQVLALTSATLLLPALAAAAPVKVPREIGYASTARVRPQVREQCALHTRIPAAIADSSDNVQLVDGSGGLRLEITNVHAPGGWIFSGPKWVEVKGSLRSGGRTLGFRAKRFSAFNPFSGGTCGILGKIARSLGSDIAGWIQSPTANAELGDAK